MTYKEKKEWAKDLFLTGNYTQKQIASKVKASEKTISKWVNEDNWDGLRKSLLTSKKEMLVFLYNQLSGIHKNINDREPGKQFADSKEADSILKLTAAIKNLETETGLGETIEVFTKLLKWLSKNDLDEAQRLEPILDSFVEEIRN